MTDARSVVARAESPAPIKTAEVLSPTPDEIEIQYRTIHGYRRAFIDVGAGPTLLLIHGIGDSSDVWRDLIPELAKYYRVIAPDLLGHGRSEKPRADYAVAAYANGMRDLLSVLGVERATVIGHSLGGGVAMQFAYQYPERCERVVLVCTGGVCREVNPFLRLAAVFDPSLLLALLAHPVPRRFAQRAAALAKRLDLDIGCDAHEFLRVFDTLPDARARRAFTRTLRGVIDLEGQHVTMLDRCYLARGMPTLLIWGARDQVIPLEHGKIANAAMPGSRLEVFDEAGHFPHRTDPQRFLSILMGFLNATAPASYSAEEWRELLRRGKPYATDSPKTGRSSLASIPRYAVPRS